MDCQPVTVCVAGLHASGIQYSGKRCQRDFVVQFSSNVALYYGQTYYTEICPCFINERYQEKECDCNYVDGAQYIYYYSDQNAQYWSMSNELGRPGYLETSNNMGGLQMPLSGWTSICWHESTGTYEKTVQTSTISLLCSPCPVGTHSVGTTGATEQSTQCACNPGYTDIDTGETLNCQPVEVCAAGQFASGIQYSRPRKKCQDDFDLAFSNSVALYNGRIYYTEICPCRVIHSLERCSCRNRQGPLYIYYHVDQNALYWGMSVTLGSSSPDSYNYNTEGVQMPLSAWQNWCKDTSTRTSVETVQTSTISLMCSPCPAGTHSDGITRATECRTCSDYADSSGENIFCKCRPGTSRARDGDTCKLCPTGKFKK